MSNIVRVQIKGVEEVRKRMDNLVVDIRRRMLIEVMKKALKTTLQVASDKAPIGNKADSTRVHRKSGARYSPLPGTLKRSFRLKKMRSDNPFVIEVQLQNLAYYALWVEYGHRIVRGTVDPATRRLIKSTKHTVGSTAPRPFMRDTFEAEKQPVIDRCNAELGAALSRRGV